MVFDAADGRRLGEVVRAVIKQLTAAGFDVRAPEADDGHHLTIVHAACARCAMAVEDDGSMRWEYRPASGYDIDPAAMAQVALHALAAEGTTPPATSTRSDLTLKGVVGQALDAGGLDVRLLVYEDLICYDVTAEIVVTNPARPDRGHVRLGDDGAITWECSRPALNGTAEATAAAVTDVTMRAIARLQKAAPSQSGELH